MPRPFLMTVRSLSQTANLLRLMTGPYLAVWSLQFFHPLPRLWWSLLLQVSALFYLLLLSWALLICLLSLAFLVSVALVLQLNLHFPSWPLVFFALALKLFSSLLIFPSQSHLTNHHLEQTFSYGNLSLEDALWYQRTHQIHNANLHYLFMDVFSAFWECECTHTCCHQRSSSHMRASSSSWDLVSWWLVVWGIHLLIFPPSLSFASAFFFSVAKLLALVFHVLMQ